MYIVVAVGVGGVVVRAMVVLFRGVRLGMLAVLWLKLYGCVVGSVVCLMVLLRFGVDDAVAIGRC